MNVLKKQALQPASLLCWTESQRMAIEVPDRFEDPNIEESYVPLLTGVLGSSKAPIVPYATRG